MSKTINLRTTSCVISAEGKKGFLDIYGRIGKDWMGDGIDAKDIKDELNEIGNVDILEIRIHSAGGFVDEGQAIITAIRRHPAEKHVFVDGQAASMASVILQVGDKRYCAKNASVFIHDPVGMCWGSLKTMKRYAEDMEQIKDQILDAYAERASISREEIADLMEQETRMTAEQALDWGFIDEIGDEMSTDAENHVSSFDDAFRIAAAADFNKLAPQLALSLTSGKPESTKETDPMSNKDPKATSPGKDPENKGTQQPAPEAQSPDDAVAAERQRVLDIQAMSQPGVEDMVEAFVKDGTEAGEAALAINKKLAENAAGQNQLDDRRQQGNDVVTDDGAAPQSIADDDFEAQWEANVGNCQDDYLSKEAFVAFKKHEAKGLIKSLSKPNNKAA